MHEAVLEQVELDPVEVQVVNSPEVLELELGAVLVALVVVDVHNLEVLDAEKLHNL